MFCSTKKKCLWDTIKRIKGYKIIYTVQIFLKLSLFILKNKKKKNHTQEDALSTNFWLPLGGIVVDNFSFYFYIFLYFPIVKKAYIPFQEKNNCRNLNLSHFILQR